MLSKFAVTVGLTAVYLIACSEAPSTAPTASASLARSSVTSSVVSTVANGASTATITVVLRSSDGTETRKSEGTVSISATSGSLGPVSDHGDGTYTSTFTAPTRIGQATIIAQLNGASLINSASIALVGGPLDIAHSSARMGVDDILADGRSAGTVSISVRDAYDNPTSKGSSQIVVASTTGTVSPVAFSSDGEYFATVTSTKTGTATVTVTIDGQAVSPAFTLRFVTGDFWLARSSMPAPRQDFATGVHDGIIYAVGGGGWPIASYSGTVEAYDPASDSWSVRPSMPTPRGELAAGVVDGILYAVGGFRTTDLSTVEAFDIATNTWSAKAPMPTAREGLAVGVVNGIVYAVGGNARGSRPLSATRFAGDAKVPTAGPFFDLRGAENVLATVEAFDPKTNTWTTKAPMPTPRSMFGVGVIDGILYAFGGKTTGGEATQALEAYDPVTNRWMVRASMPSITPAGIGYGRAALAGAAVNGNLYAVGGFQVYQETDMVEAYDPATNAWRRTKSLPMKRQSLGVGVVDGVIYAIGGACYDDTFSMVESYQPP